MLATAKTADVLLLLTDRNTKLSTNYHTDETSAFSYYYSTSDSITVASLRVGAQEREIA